MGDSRAEETIIKAFYHPSQNITAVAFSAFENFRNPELIGSIIDRLKEQFKRYSNRRTGFEFSYYTESIESLMKINDDNYEFIEDINQLEKFIDLYYKEGDFDECKVLLDRMKKLC